MRFKKEVIVIALIFVSLALGMGSWPAPVQAMDCTVTAFQALNLTDGTDWVNGQPVPGTGKPVTINSATMVLEDKTNNIPAYCDVIGTMWPTIRFEVALPTTTPTSNVTTTYNGRLLMAGNGGKAGTISEGTSASTLLDSGAIVPAVQMGYAATSTDTGHCSAYLNAAGTNGGCPAGTTLFPDAYFAYIDYPTTGANPDWYAKMIDFAYLSVHETINVAKQMVQAYYATPPAYTYWVGCSTGGRQGLQEAYRYPKDFNGIVDGSAVNHYLKQQMFGPEQLNPQYTPGCNVTNTFCGGGQIPPNNLAYLGQVVYTKCDGIDGLVDGLIDDPRNCHIDVDKDLAKCPQDSYADYTTQPTNCFTSAQLGALKQIYGGAFTSKGKLVVEGLPPGSETMSGGWSSWFVNKYLGSTSRYSVVGVAFNFLMFDPQRPSFNYLTDWNWNTDPPLMAERDKLFSPAPDLRGFYHHGGKILMYHGWADPSANPLADTLPYYEDVAALMPQTKDFLAYYLVPGMGHCGGGVGCGNVDWLTPLINWVEHDQAPGALQGSSTLTSGPYATRTRPICRYPEVARWEGAGDQNNWLSFSCVPPVEVRLQPETLNLKSKDVFTAFITMPRGFDVRDWHIHDVTCEGASAVKGMASREGYIATFRTRDLREVSPGKAVVLTVKLAFYHDGKDALTQGSDTVRVIREDRDRGHEEWGHNDHHDRGKVAFEQER